ncbi:hypothetical protein ABIA38_008518 [Embleya sp. AB8]
MIRTRRGCRFLPVRPDQQAGHEGDFDGRADRQRGAMTDDSREIAAAIPMKPANAAATVAPTYLQAADQAREGTQVPCGPVPSVPAGQGHPHVPRATHHFRNTSSAGLPWGVYARFFGVSPLSGQSSHIHQQTPAHQGLPSKKESNAS